MNGNDRKESRVRPVLTCSLKMQKMSTSSYAAECQVEVASGSAPVMKLVTHVCPAPSSQAVRVPVAGPTGFSFAGGRWGGCATVVMTPATICAWRGSQVVVQARRARVGSQGCGRLSKRHLVARHLECSVLLLFALLTMAAKPTMYMIPRLVNTERCLVEATDYLYSVS